MKKCFYGVLVLLVACLALLLIALIISDGNEFNDYSALVVEIEPNGTVTLRTPDIGTVKGPLNGVAPIDDLYKYPDVKALISGARHDKMLFHINDNGSIDLWYNCQGDPVALNPAIAKKLDERSLSRVTSGALDENCPSLK